MKYLDLETAEEIVQFVEDFFSEEVKIREKYSGRGMYGRTCVGLVVDNPMHVAYACGKLGVELPEHQDSMGYQTIVY